MAMKTKPYIMGATWINDGSEEKIVAGSELDAHCENGWWVGMLGTEKPVKKPGRPKKVNPEPVTADELKTLLNKD